MADLAEFKVLSAGKPGLTSLKTSNTLSPIGLFVPNQNRGETQFNHGSNRGGLIAPHCFRKLFFLKPPITRQDCYYSPAGSRVPSFLLLGSSSVSRHATTKGRVMESAVTRT